MGCFLGCFGISTKRNRRKQPPRRILPGDSLQKLLSYEQLDSSVSIDIPENPISSNSQQSDKPKERSSIKIKKKVSFNLNVQTYEPIPDAETTTYQFLQSVEEEEEGTGKNGADTGKGSLPSFSEKDSSSLQMSSSYPANYRYQNCRESYDEEEDEMTYGESDLEDDLDDDNDEDDYFYDYDDDDKDDDQCQLDDDKAKNKMPVPTSKDGELKSLGCENARIRSQYLFSVLNPVENTTQWKEIKEKAKEAGAAAPPKYRSKENIAVEEEEPQMPFSSKLRSECLPNYNQSKPLLQDISVDASLSNWLIPPNTDGAKSCSGTFDMPSSNKNSFSWGSREDRVILDITNLEAL